MKESKSSTNLLPLQVVENGITKNINKMKTNKGEKKEEKKKKKKKKKAIEYAKQAQDYSIKLKVDCYRPSPGEGPIFTVG